MRAAQLRGSGDKLNNLKLRSEDTVTIDHTKEEVDCPTVTGFEGHPPLRSTKAVSTNDLIQRLTQSNAWAVIPYIQDLSGAARKM